MPRLLDPGRFWPVCCAADVSAKAKDHFLQLNLDYLVEAAQDELYFVFVDDMSKTYSKEDELGRNVDSSPTSPFKGKTVAETAALVQQLRRDESDIDHEHFIIMDERTLRDDTVLLAEIELLTEGEKAANVSVRMASEIVAGQLFVYMSCKTSLAEDGVKAQRHEDGVVREADMHTILTREEEERVFGPFDR